MLACKFSNIESNNETVKMLLNYKADVNLRNNVHDSLYYACKYCGISNNNDTINILLDCPTITINNTDLKELLRIIYMSKHMQLDTLGKLLQKIVY